MIASPVLGGEFIGRGDVLASLVSKLRDADQSRGCVLLIRGETGIGKTRLITEFRKTVAGSNVLFGLGTCSEYIQTPFSPILDALHQLFSDDRIQGRTHHALQQLLTEARVAPNPASPPPDDQRKYQQFSAVARFLRNLARKRSVVIAVEDLHWADSASLELLDYLSRSLTETRILFVLTHRSDVSTLRPQLASALARLARNGAAIKLEALSMGEIRFLIHRTVGNKRAISVELIDRIERLAEGNPLFTEELLRSALDGVLDPFLASDNAALSIRTIIKERLTFFDKREQTILARAAVLGRHFDAEFLAEIGEESLESALAVIRIGQERNVVTEDHTSRGSYVFCHELIREALYQELVITERRRIHAVIARHLETLVPATHRIGELAYHWSATNDAAKAIHYNELAGDAASEVYAHRDAARFYQQALDFTAESGTHRARLCEKLAYALSVGGFGEHARPWFERALDEYRRLDDAERMVQILLNTSAQCWVNAETESALHMCARALDVLARLPNNSLQFDVLVMTATYEVLLGRYDEALVHLDAGDQLLCERDNGYVARFFDVRGTARDSVGAGSEAMADFQAALRIANEVDDADLITRVCSNFADFAIGLGDFERAAECWERSLLVADENGFVWHKSFAALSFAWLCLLQGHLEKARQLVNIALAEGEEAPLARILAASVGIPLGLQLNDKSLVARCAGEETIDLAFRSGEAQHIGGVVTGFVDLWMTQGRIEAARDLLHRAVFALPSADQAEEVLLRVAAHGDQADIARARTLLGRWARCTHHKVAQAHLAFFECLVAMSERNRDAAKMMADEAASLYDKLGMPYHRARALEGAGRQAEALALYRRIGDVRDVGRLDHFAPSHPPTATLEALTPRQRQIVRLVIACKTNREIAVELNISRRTVDHHMDSILSRLELRSRFQLLKIWDSTQLHS